MFLSVQSSWLSQQVIGTFQRYAGYVSWSFFPFSQVHAPKLPNRFAQNLFELLTSMRNI